MDQNSNLSLNLPPEVPSNYPLYPTPKHKTPKLKKWEFLVFPFLVIMIGLWYGGYFHTSAADNPMQPNTVLDPSCPPTETNCFVQILPDQFGKGGKYLSTNGTTTSWADIVLSFNGAQTNYRSGLTSATSDTAVASSTDLVSFIQNYFFPGTYNLPVITPSWSNTTVYIGNLIPSIAPTTGASEYSVNDNGNTAVGTTTQAVTLATCGISPGYYTTTGSTFPSSGASTASPVTYTHTYSFKEGINAGGCRNFGHTPGDTATPVVRTLTVSWAQPTITSMSVSGGTTGPFEWGKTFAFTANVNKTITANNVTAVTLSSTASGAYTALDAVNMSTIGSSVTTATQSQTFTSTLTPNYASLPSGNTTYQLAASSQYLTSTPPDVTNTITFANANFMPAVYYGLSSDNLMNAGSFPDVTSTTSGTLNNKIQNLGTGPHLQNTRTIASNTYTNSSLGVQKWVYFAWPSYSVPNSNFVSYEPDAIISGSGLTAVLGSNGCKALQGDGSNHDSFSSPGTDCFLTTSSFSPDSFFYHRSLSNFTNEYGVVMHYELYQSEVLYSLTSAQSAIIKVP